MDRKVGIWIVGACGSVATCAVTGAEALKAGVIPTSGLVTELSTLEIEPRWKTAVGFAVLIIVLFVRPQGIFGKATAI